MKVQIRRSVFETNSSSTHSLQCVKKYKDVFNDIRKRMTRRNNKRPDDMIMDPEDYIKDGVLYLRGYEFEQGEECGDVYYILTSWMSKIQYVAMLIDDYGYYFPTVDKQAWKSCHNYHVSRQIVFNCSTVQKIKEIIKESCATHGYPVNDVVFDMKYDGTCVDYYVKGDTLKIDNFDYETDKCYSDTFSEGEEKILDDIKDMLSDDYELIYSDEAYSPYNKPEFYNI